ncbi:MAG: Imidazoleglycerol-phosphate dehydratase [Firmicutes bacterium]|nr:Imidazoleglycerol-phosphate dehydratase [Bacillota bacterium]
MRRAEQSRETKETTVKTILVIDGSGSSQVDTGVGFFDHMLELFARHGFFDLMVKAEGDTRVDYHHTVEDTGIVLGKAIALALGDRSGIRRYSTEFTPMDESLSMISLDVSGRPYLYFDVQYTGERVGGFDVELVEEFFRALCNNGGLTLHVKLIHGRNNHHIIESIFKGFGRALDRATSVDDRVAGVLSTKGIL